VNPPKFPDEPVRHKILDMIGDLYLAGIPLRFLDVVAAKSGHAANVRMAEKVTQLVQIKQSCCTC
jgi:UDP-3-O-acyl-N-acetylglucosamine deacetylase